ncbi:MAG: hypothetical protein AAFX90_21565 [Pseudomonadota bacterium]
MLELVSCADSLRESKFYDPQTRVPNPAAKREASVVAGKGRVGQTIHGAPFHSKVTENHKIQLTAAGKLQSQLLAFQDLAKRGDATLTASTQNTSSSFKMLKKGIEWFKSNKDLPAEERVWYVEILLDSFEKCMDSLAAQIRFYKSAKSPTRALTVTHNDGREEFVSGQKVQTLCLHLPGSAEDAVVFGKPEALNAIADALAAAGHKISGPAAIHEHAEQLGKLPHKTVSPSAE